MGNNVAPSFLDVLEVCKVPKFQKFCFFPDEPLLQMHGSMQDSGGGVQERRLPVGPNLDFRGSKSLVQTSPELLNVSVPFRIRRHRLRGTRPA